MWHGLSVTCCTRCGMLYVLVHNTESSWLDHGQTALEKRRPLICLLHHPLIVAQVYNLDNFHWVLCLLLIAPIL